MRNLSQNSKIVVSAVAVFIVSFSVMVFFLGEGQGTLESAQTNVMHGSENSDTAPVNEEKTYREAIGNDSDPIFVTDSEGKFVFLGESFCEVMALDCEELNGKLLFDYINGKDLSNFVSAQTKVVNTKENVKGSGPYRMLSGDKDKEIMVLFDMVTVLNKDKTVEKIIFAVKNITSKIEEMDEDDGQKEKTLIEILYPGVKSIKDLKEQQQEQEKKLVFGRGPPGSKA